LSRRSSSGDEFGSLDLLLDTICNMFGLFIFVGMLVALLASARSTEVVSQGTPAAAVDPLAADRAAIERLRERVQMAEAKVSGDAKSEQARGRLVSLQARNDELDRGVRMMESLLKDGGARAEANIRELPRLRAEIQRLEAQVQAQARTEGIRLRAPRRRSVEGLMPVQVVLWKDRAYWINPWIDRVEEPCAAWSEWNPDAVDLARDPQCEIRECFRGGGQWLIRSVPLRADGGLDVSEGADAWQGALATLLGRLRGERHVISLKVAPDSHAAFQRVRDAIAATGLSYDVSPIRIEDGVYRDEIRDGIATAQ
jgi:hypothetical protein